MGMLDTWAGHFKTERSLTAYPERRDFADSVVTPTSDSPKASVGHIVVNHTLNLGGHVALGPGFLHRGYFGG